MGCYYHISIAITVPAICSLSYPKTKEDEKEI
jgi:hypothetical protein